MSPNPFEPLRIGSSLVPNRFFLAPVKTALGGADGKVSPRHVSYYRRRAQGGTGTLISEPLFVDPVGKEHPKQLGIDDDDKVLGLRVLVDAMHGGGALAVAHLNHAGRAANPKASGTLPEAPSAVACPATGVTPRELTIERIVELEGRFAQGAARAVEAGFDGVEVQLGLGYLAAQFLSPRTNRRQDEYGPAGDGRWRFAERVVRGVRGVLGPSRFLIVRLSAEERVEGGLGIDDAIELARRARAWGADAIHVVTGTACDAPSWYYQHMSLVEGVNEKLAGRIRQAVGGPVIVAGRLGDPARVRELIGSEQVDAVALGRSLLADPDLPAKMRSGREDSIQLCGGCLQGCLAKVKQGGPIGCIVNPSIGREDDAAPAASVRRHVVVVGGGPAGLQAAITASDRGHRVTLLEKKEKLGGQFALSFLSPGKEAMRRPFDALVARAERAPIDRKTGVQATVDAVMDLRPDVVVIATGSEPARLPVPGLQHAWSGADVLTGRAPLGRRALVVGGGMVGIEVADHLGLRGVETVVVEALGEIARDMETVTRKLTLKRLASLPVTILTNTKLTAVTDGEAIVQAEQGEPKSLGRFDMVIVAVGSRSVEPLSTPLKSRGVTVHVIGDAASPAQVLDATRAGYDIAMSL